MPCLTRRPSWHAACVGPAACYDLDAVEGQRVPAQEPADMERGTASHQTPLAAGRVTRETSGSDGSAPWQAMISCPAG